MKKAVILTATALLSSAPAAALDQKAFFRDRIATVVANYFEDEGRSTGLLCQRALSEDGFGDAVRKLEWHVGPAWDVHRDVFQDIIEDSRPGQGRSLYEAGVRSGRSFCEHPESVVHQWALAKQSVGVWLIEARSNADLLYRWTSPSSRTSSDRTGWR